LNWYFEDGQTLSQIADWQNCLTESREEGLSVLAASLDELDAEDAMREAEALSGAWAMEMTVLHRLSDELMHDLPRAEGFFVGDAERGGAHAAVCHFFARASEPFERLGQINLRMCSLCDRSREGRLREDRVLRELTLAKHAAERMHDPALCEQIADLAEALYRIREKNVRLRRTVEEISPSWFAFCTKQFPALTVRIGTCADLEQEGRRCEPRALPALCAEIGQLIRTHLTHT
jgi:hypothetical protein